jgi:hypothetical protein
MTFTSLPHNAAWQHRDARSGFEVVWFRAEESGYRFDGHTTAVEDGQPWAVHYLISLDENWITKTAQILGWSGTTRRQLRLESDGSGQWRVDGAPAPECDGCLDIDLESSACTNTIPVHRLGLAAGKSSEAPAACVRALDLRVDRLEQHYRHMDGDPFHQRYHYRAPAFGFEAQLLYDDAGLVLEYPGIASRVL